MNNDIKESYCSIEVSKLLKKKGCDVASPYWDFEKCGELSVRKLTHALAIEWVRVNFGIWIEIRHIKTFGVNRFHVIIWKYGEDYYRTIHCDNNVGYAVWDSPQEATDAALLYTLTNLI